MQRARAYYEKCSFCGAEPETHCVGKNGKLLKFYHNPRIRAAGEIPRGKKQSGDSKGESRPRRTGRSLQSGGLLATTLFTAQEVELLPPRDPGESKSAWLRRLVLSTVNKD